MPTLGFFTFTVDRLATAQAYRTAGNGGADSCSCRACRNFRLVRDSAFPPEFLRLLEELGIDPVKDGEVYHNARIGPARHDYAGWFHFVGTLDEAEDLPGVRIGEGFTVWLCRANAPRLKTLDGLAAVQLEFHAESVPWVLDEPEVD
jgi:hypothetical protein